MNCFVFYSQIKQRYQRSLRLEKITNNQKGEEREIAQNSSAKRAMNLDP